ncbi:MAG: amino acid racemase [Nitrospira sp.]|nr:amino acid racemase [Nitrospira sp.]
MTDTPLERPPHIGIIAGTAEGAALCYRTLCHEAEKFMGRHAHPEITLHTFSLRSYFDLIDRDDWSGVADLLSRSASTLANAGADLIICPNNTLHRAYDLVHSPVPWLHIAAVVSEEAAGRKFQRVGLLGTQTVMEGTIYLPHLTRRGIEPVIPDTQARIRIQHIIRTELIGGYSNPESRSYLREVIAELAATGAEAVILGCTELPLILSDELSPIPLLDSTRLLAGSALQRVTSRRRDPAVRNNRPVIAGHEEYSR